MTVIAPGGANDGPVLVQYVGRAFLTMWRFAMRRTRLVVSVSSILLLVSVAKVDAATYTWANTGTDWGNGANWGGTPPGGSDVGQFTLPSYNFQPNVAELDTIGGVWNTVQCGDSYRVIDPHDQRHHDWQQRQYRHRA